jgi:hypothetical protein
MLNNKYISIFITFTLILIINRSYCITIFGLNKTRQINNVNIFSLKQTAPTAHTFNLMCNKSDIGRYTNDDLIMDQSSIVVKAIAFDKFKHYDTNTRRRKYLFLFKIEYVYKYNNSFIDNNNNNNNNDIVSFSRPLIHSSNNKDTNLFFLIENNNCNNLINDIKMNETYFLFLNNNNINNVQKYYNHPVRLTINKYELLKLPIYDIINKPLNVIQINESMLFHRIVKVKFNKKYTNVYVKQNVKLVCQLESINVVKYKSIDIVWKHSSLFNTTFTSIINNDTNKYSIETNNE